jgi:hypothetical protein
MLILPFPLVEVAGIKLNLIVLNERCYLEYKGCGEKGTIGCVEDLIADHTLDFIGLLETVAPHL